MYELSKTECLYIATKFNDEARAKLILRWEQLETDNPTRTGSPETLNLLAGQHELIEMLKKELCDIREAAGSMERTLKARQAEKYMRSTFISFSRYLKKKYPRVNLTPEKQEEYEWWLKMHCKDNDVPIDEVYDDNRYPIEAIDDFFWQSLNRYKIK
jgi:hypothetical protein